MTRVQAALNVQLNRQNDKLEVELKEKVLVMPYFTTESGYSFLYPLA